MKTQKINLLSSISIISLLCSNLACAAGEVGECKFYIKSIDLASVAVATFFGPRYSDELTFRWTIKNGRRQPLDPSITFWEAFSNLKFSEDDSRVMSFSLALPDRPNETGITRYLDFKKNYPNANYEDGSMEVSVMTINNKNPPTRSGSFRVSNGACRVEYFSDTDNKVSAGKELLIINPNTPL
jgi:hypothetical protein